MAKVTIAGARVSKGWSQKELAERMGVSRDTVAKWESGRSSMKPAYLFLFCEITGFGEDEILLPNKAT